jgi:hypothetical protein
LIADAWTVAVGQSPIRDPTGRDGYFSAVPGGNVAQFCLRIGPEGLKRLRKPATSMRLECRPFMLGKISDGKEQV